MSDVVHAPGKAPSHDRGWQTPTPICQRRVPIQYSSTNAAATGSMLLLMRNSRPLQVCQRGPGQDAPAIVPPLWPITRKV